MNDLIKNGWRMKEIDEMDMLGFLRLREMRPGSRKRKTRQRFIDD